MKKIFFIEALAVFLALIIGVMLINAQTARYFSHKAPQTDNTPPKDFAIPVPKIDPYRIKGPLSFTAERPDYQNGWTFGTVAGRSAWLDHKTGMVWGNRLPDISYEILNTGNTRLARAACKRAEPAGFWDLPTKDEMQDARAHGLIDIDPEAKRRWVSYKINNFYQLYPFASSWGEDTARTFYVRCVGYAAAEEP